MSFVDDKIIEKHFNNILIKRIVNSEISSKLNREDIYFISEFGLPNNILDFNFSEPIKNYKCNEIVIGFLNEEIILNTNNRIIYKEKPNFYLAKNIKNFIYQLFTIDFFWKEIVTNELLGSYDLNHKIYASFLEKKLKEIDEELFLNDSAYFWGSLIESIEFGII